MRHPRHGLFHHFRKNYGFTLLELVLAMVLVCGMAAMSFVSLRPSIEQEGPRGLVHVLAADLRVARAEAQRSGRLVAFCFPSAGRTHSVARSAHIRVGDQKGKVWRRLAYESEYEAAIFVGSWGDAVRESYELPSGWRTSTSRESAIYFQPDGTAFSEDVPCLDGRYPLVIGSAMTGDFQGPQGRLTSIRHPQTIWISKRGTVEVAEGNIPVGSLPTGGTELPPFARLEAEPSTSGSAPTVVSANFLPQQVEGLDTAGIGQNFVQIHPDQKEGQQLEYGLATIDVAVEDVDGGPLSYQLRATASAGDSGKFTVSEKTGELSYIYDETTRRYLWKAVVSWRPPPSAPPDRTYELYMTILDPEGNSVEVSTDAGLLPAVKSLPPARLVFCTDESEMYLANLDGANEILLTLNGPEREPFFSQDGSCLFSFHNLGDGSGKELRSRPANGSTTFTPLASFTGSTSDVIFDPTYTFAALINPAGPFVFSWGSVSSSTTETTNDDGTTSSSTSYSFAPGATEVDVSNVYILSLMAAEKPIRVTKTGTGKFFWAANARHTFLFEHQVPTPPITEHGFGPFSPAPGFLPEEPAKYLSGFPPHLLPTDVEPESAANRVYNPANRDWYLRVEGDRLLMGHQPSGSVYTLHSGSGAIEHSETGRRNPAWSADGLRVAFVSSSGAAARVVSLRVLQDGGGGGGLSAMSSPVVEFEQAVDSASRAQLSPGGEWVYVLSNNKLLRAENRTGSAFVDITAHLGKGIADYAVSP